MEAFRLVVDVLIPENDAVQSLWVPYIKSFALDDRRDIINESSSLPIIATYTEQTMKFHDGAITCQFTLEIPTITSEHLFNIALSPGQTSVHEDLPWWTDSLTGHEGCRGRSRNLVERGFDEEMAE